METVHVALLRKTLASSYFKYVCASCCQQGHVHTKAAEINPAVFKWYADWATLTSINLASKSRLPAVQRWYWVVEVRRLAWLCVSPH